MKDEDPLAEAVSKLLAFGKPCEGSLDYKKAWLAVKHVMDGTKEPKEIRLQWFPSTDPRHKSKDKQPQGVVFGSIWFNGMVDLIPGDWIIYNEKWQVKEIIHE